MASGVRNNKTLDHIGPGPVPGARPVEGEDDPFDLDDGPGVSGVFHHLHPDDTVPGTRYRVVRHIGDGGMGQVYEVAHLDIERRAALKILAPALCSNPNAAQMFRDEARTASKVGADEIIEIYDFIELPDGRVGFAMELLTGETVAEAIRSHPMAPDRVLGILRQICKGLEAAHEAGVIHRDIKPENIVLQRRRQRSDVVKILDFGIAAMMRDGVAEESLTAGTPLYLSPELIRGEPFDHRVDIYALGCVAYEMLTGTSPFETEDNKVSSVLKKHLEETPPPPNKIRSGIPGALEDVIMKCIEKEPSDRPADMAELEAALCQAQIEAKLVTTWDDLPLPDKVDPNVRDRLLREMPDMVTGRSPAVAQRRGPWPWVAGISVVIALGAVGVLATRDDRTTNRADVEDEEAGPVTVEGLVAQAREAAARNHFVYPPTDNPGQPTAYTQIVKLESMRGPDRDRAMQEAMQLRQELSDVLVRLGDAYWQRDTGRQYAVDFYKQALIFDRSHPRAIERVGAEVDEIAALEEKAQNAEFSAEEIEASEALAEEAEPDPKKRQRKLARITKVVEPAPTPTAPPVEEERDSDLSDLDAQEGDEPAPEVEAPAKTKPTIPEPAAKANSAARAEAATLTRQAKSEYSAGRAGRAQTLLDQALAKAPNYVPALEALYNLHARAERWGKTVDIARRLTKAEPSRPLHFIRLGDAQMRAGNPSAALEAYRRGDELGSAKARTRVARLEKKLGIEHPKPAAQPPPEPAVPAEESDEPDDAAEDEEPDDAGDEDSAAAE
jgi:serine/threonine protein kinase/tetratricopeptide (TPR) repeat protein